MNSGSNVGFHELRARHNEQIFQKYLVLTVKITQAITQQSQCNTTQINPKTSYILTSEQAKHYILIQNNQ